MKWQKGLHLRLIWRDQMHYHLLTLPETSRYRRCASVNYYLKMAGSVADHHTAVPFIKHLFQLV